MHHAEFMIMKTKAMMMAIMMQMKDSQVLFISSWNEISYEIYKIQQTAAHFYHTKKNPI